MRTKSNTHGTFGLIYFGGDQLFSAEPPWKNNLPGISCIPSGVYSCKPTQSPKFGATYEIENVPGRSHILFHAGNYAGDTDAGLISDTNGCILLGRATGNLAGQDVIVSSKPAVKRFIMALKSSGDLHTLHISEINGIR